MRGIGKGVREFNDAKEHVKSQLDEGMKEKMMLIQGLCVNPDLHLIDPPVS